jgi:hypothetical protein
VGTEHDLRGDFGREVEGAQFLRKVRPEYGDHCGRAIANRIYDAAGTATPKFGSADKALFDPGGIGDGLRNAFTCMAKAEQEKPHIADGFRPQACRPVGCRGR